MEKIMMTPFRGMDWVKDIKKEGDTMLRSSGSL
jgi:hypothetical protein